MAKLAETFEWAATTDIEPLRQTVRTAGLFPLRAIGSGGSLTAAHALAAFHQRLAGKIAAVATPLEAADEPLDVAVATWLLSAGGGNVDIRAAAKALIGREPRHLAVLCGRDESPLADICRVHPFVDLLIYPSPAGKDGFLATNSLLGFITLLARAYTAVFAAEKEWVDAVGEIRRLLDDHSGVVARWEDSVSVLWSRPTTLVLHGPSTRIGAVDLESKFTEAALGTLQVADYRNFAHGRHHWLAKRGETSAVLAFVTENDVALAERTLALIPENIPQARLTFSGNPTATALAAVIAALRITGWAGAARGIDPGRPGVPEFGRKLYGLTPSRSRRDTDQVGLSPRDAAAIRRKAGVIPSRLAATGELSRWRAALDRFRERLGNAAFAGIALDYDGTVVDARSRRDPPDQMMADALARIVGAGAWLAIATGRGKSVRDDLRKRLPRDIWSKVLIGYYNGAEVALLEEDGAPDGSEGTCSELVRLAEALRTLPELALATCQTNRRSQITLKANRVMSENRLWDLAWQVILMTGTADVTVTRSSHSVDIVAAGVSKLNVLTRLRDHVGSGPVLTIGDRGCWPGNDYELLGEPYALSVDEVSADPTTCWNLAQPGQRGPAATLDYLSSLWASAGTLRFSEKALR